MYLPGAPLMPVGGNDSFDGGPGSDSSSYYASEDGLIADMASGAASVQGTVRGGLT